jgi:amino acid transporter
VLDATAMAVVEKAKLQKHFSRFDIYFFLVCTLVGVDTLGLVASKGPEGFTWMVVLGMFFFVPYALLTAELGAAFTDEGGSYVWTRLAFGRKVAAIGAVLYWFSNPVWIGATLAVLALGVIDAFFFRVAAGSVLWYVVGLTFVWFSVWAAVLSFGIGKWIPTLGAWCRMGLLGMFVVSTVVYAFEHGLHLPAAHRFAPSYQLFIALVPVLFFNYVGFELPSAAGDEMKDPQKDVPIAVLRAMITSILMYGLPILAIICVLPADQITGIGGFMSAVALVFTVWGAAAGVVTKIAAAGFILALVSSACTWLMGSDRSQAVACYDGAGPRFLGRFSGRYGTPVNVNAVSGVLSTIVFVAATAVTTGDASAVFNTMIGVVLLFTTMSYLVIFPALIKLRYSHAHVHRPYRIPGGMAGVWICGLLTSGWALFASIVGLFPGFGAHGQLLDDAALPVGKDGAPIFSRAIFELITFTPLVITLAAGVLFYVLGAPQRAETARLRARTR